MFYDDVFLFSNQYIGNYLQIFFVFLVLRDVFTVITLSIVTLIRCNLKSYEYNLFLKTTLLKNNQVFLQT